MQFTSKAYKTEQLQEYRQQSYVYVYLGVVSREAQENAYVSSELLPLSDTSQILAEPNFEAYYGMMEQDFFRVDGSTIFPPRNLSLVALYQGAISEDLLDGITFSFDGYSELDIKGLTINFGDYYPTRFQVTNGNDTYTYDNDSPQFVCEDVFRESAEIIITPLAMVGGQQRMRILSIMFGVGLTFDNTQLLSTSRKNTVSHISDTLPSKGFDFRINNRSRRFSQDDPNSFIHFLEEQQVVEYVYARDVPTGYDEWGYPTGLEKYYIDGGIVQLKTWSSNDSEASFSAVGFLDYQQGTYYKGRHYPNGSTVYDEALRILVDAGIENYRLDTYLKNLLVYNPVPNDTHKACLQLLANYARCILYEDRQGRVVIESSFVPEVQLVTCTDAEDSTNIEEIVTVADLKSYQSAELDYSQTNNTMFLKPRSGGDSGYVSNVISDALGYFSGIIPINTEDDETLQPYDGTILATTQGGTRFTPSITVKFEAQWTFFNLEVEFGFSAPREVIINAYADNAIVSTVRHVADGEYFDLTQVFEQEFREVDQITIQFVRTHPGQRIHVNHIKFGDVTDYTIRYRDMSQTPVATSLDQVKQINFHYYTYDPSDEQTSLVKTNVSVGDNLITFKDAATNYAVSWVDENASGTLTIVESGAYYCVVNSDAAGQINVQGNKYIVSDSIYQHNVHESGVTKTVQNELVSTLAQATLDAAWLAEHFAADTEYNITYRGEPALDCDDLIYVENKYVTNNLVRVTEETLNTSVGMDMNCTIKGRRLSYGGA